MNHASQFGILDNIDFCLKLIYFHIFGNLLPLSMELPLTLWSGVSFAFCLIAVWGKYCTLHHGDICREGSLSICDHIMYPEIDTVHKDHDMYMYS